MEQINFRISPEEKRMLQIIADERSITITELARSALFKEIAPKRVDFAFKLLAEGKIGRKKAWVLSGLTYHEFLVEWTKRGAEEHIPDSITVNELEIITKIDLKKHQK